MSRRLVVGLAGAVFLAVVASVWFTPTGTGEFRDSPDGRYTAHAYNMTAGTLFHGQEPYLRLRVVEAASGAEVWRVIRRHPAGADVPDYGRRGERFIAWAADSSAVTVPVGGGRTLTLAVP